MRVHGENSPLSQPPSAAAPSSTSRLTRWCDVLQELSGLHISPFNAQKSTSMNGNGCKYVKLLSRNRNDSYEKRCSQLTGTKKERLKRHLQLKEENKDSDFFSSMRNEGGVHLVGATTDTSIFYEEWVISILIHTSGYLLLYFYSVAFNENLLSSASFRSLHFYWTHNTPAIGYTNTYL